MVATKAMSTRGFAATAAGSIPIPEVTRKMGMSSPNARPSSLCGDETDGAVGSRRPCRTGEWSTTVGFPTVPAPERRTMGRRPTRGGRHSERRRVQLEPR
jgi:hypothetical protein